MADTPSKRTTTVSGTGSVVVRQRPSLLLMRLTLRATEQTLELGFAKLRKQCEQVEKWLKRLDAERVEFGEPHFSDQDNGDPMKQHAKRMSSVLAMGKASAPKEEAMPQKLNVVATAIWPIGSLSAEQVLIRVDRLRFETADTDTPPESAETAPWASPEEQMQEVMARMFESFTDTDKPVILFVSKLSEEQLTAATTEAVALARRSAERMARAFGKPLGTPTFTNVVSGRMANLRADKMMTRQRCEMLLAGTSYHLDEDEVVSDDPRSAEFHLSVTVNYELADKVG